MGSPIEGRNRLLSARRHISAGQRWGGARLERPPWSHEPKVTVFSYADMGKRRLSDKEREQLERDRERFRFGTQGAASAVRKVDLASVDTAAWVAQIERQPLALKSETSRASDYGRWARLIRQPTSGAQRTRACASRRATGRACPVASMLSDDYCSAVAMVGLNCGHLLRRAN
jgi:hypothetical protein